MVESTPTAVDYDAVVIGAGFAGMYAIHKLRELNFSVRAFETGAGVGGTWFWNRYPGARCDVESLSYSYTFDPKLVQDWSWSERFATQPEILQYAEWVADKLDLNKHISFDTRVDRAEYDEATSTWLFHTGDGICTRARYCITAVGCLSAASVPDFPAVETFTGDIYHTGRWPHEGVDFTGRKVAVIGTGSSGIQAIPEISRQAAQLTVFQRTPNYTLPARNRPLNADEHAFVRKNHALIRERARHCPTGTGITYGLNRTLEVGDQDRTDILDRYWHNGGNLFLTAFYDVGLDLEANNEVADYVRNRISTIVDDPEVAARLTPTDYPIGAKRICVDTDYYATYNQPHVELVDVRETPITTFTSDGLSTTDRNFDFDAVVMATGYDGMTGSLTRIDIRGRGGGTLRDKWATGPKTYLGVATHGFPNMFMITGPGSPSVLANVIACIEQHVDWIADCLVALRTAGTAEIEAQRDDEEKWVEHVDSVASQTLFIHAKSWYLGDNIAGKPRVFMPYPGGLNVYRDKCDAVAKADYEGFSLVSASSTTAPPPADSARA